LWIFDENVTCSCGSFDEILHMLSLLGRFFVIGADKMVLYKSPRVLCFVLVCFSFEEGKVVAGVRS